MAYQSDITSIPAALPVDYDRQYDFVTYQSASPTAPLPASQIEAEFNAVEQALDQTQARLRLIQKDDGNLVNGIVTKDALSAEAGRRLGQAADWATGTDYDRFDLVWNDRKLYYANGTHTSDPTAFVNDSDKWDLIVDLDQYVSVAETEANNANVAAANAATSEANAAASETDASEHVITASRYASEAEDTTVVDADTGSDTGTYSALHHRNKAEDAQTAAETAQTGAETARTAAETAQTAAETAQTAAETAETGAQTAESGAQTAESGAQTAEAKAQDWAEQPEDVTVETSPNQYSALHHAAKADGHRIAAAASESAAATSEANAATSESNAATSESNAATSEANAAASESSAADSSTLADRYATEAEDVIVVDPVGGSTGEYSAFHYMKKAQSAVATAMEYQGSWDASSGSYPSSPNLGDLYKVNIAGTTDGVQYNVGDQIIYNGGTATSNTGWDHVDNTETVTSVAGRVGDITLSAADIGLVDAGGNYAATEVEAALAEEADARQAHEADTGNPHSVTKAQVGLGSVDNKSSSTIAKEQNATNLGSGNDLDALSDGWYAWAGSAPANAPNGDSYYIMVQQSDASQKIQMAFGNSGSGRIFVRRADIGTFYAWTEMWGAGNSDAFDNAGNYASLRAQATTKADVGLGNVPNVDATVAANIAIVDSGGNYVATDVEAALAEEADARQAHEADTSNPHSVTASQVGLGNVLNVEQAARYQGINTKTANYTLALGDDNDFVEMSMAGANNLTVPPNSSVAFPIGTEITVVQYGPGQTTIVAGSGVTLRTSETLLLRAQYSAVTLIKRGTDEWYVFGDVELA